MRKGPISDVIARPVLPPGNLACEATGFSERSDPLRVPVDSLVWTLLGVAAVWIAA